MASTSLNIKNILLVPKIGMNLLYVKKLNIDNNTCVEFHIDYCLLNEKKINKIVLKGSTKDRL